MIMTTTSELPSQQVVGIVTASANCLREYQYKFDQQILDELTTQLQRQAENLGGDAVIGVTIQLHSPVVHGSVQHQMRAFGTAVKTA